MVNNPGGGPYELSCQVTPDLKRNVILVFGKNQ